MNLNVNNLNLSYQGRQVLTSVGFEVEARQTIGLLGPNGSGKSTLIRCLAGLVASARSAVSLGGQKLQTLSQRDLARRVAFVPQHSETQLPLTVKDIIRLGRTPHRGRFSHWTPEDDLAVNEAIHLMKLQTLLERTWDRLSGGERQRCQIARALAQKPQILLLDEPTNHLDIQYQLELMQLIQALPVTVVVALHDLNLAANYCDSLILLKEGEIKAAGMPDEILTTDLIKNVWKVEATVVRQVKKKLSIHFECPHSRQQSTGWETKNFYAA